MNYILIKDKIIYLSLNIIKFNLVNHNFLFHLNLNYKLKNVKILFFFL